jgi:hypothetical protein
MLELGRPGRALARQGRGSQDGAFADEHSNMLDDERSYVAHVEAGDHRPRGADVASSETTSG